MNFDEVIENRRSVRSYLDKEVSDDLIYKILDYGHSAPTAGNLQPWEFLVVKNEENKKAIVNTTFVGNNEESDNTQKWMLSAPVFIVVCGNSEKIKQRYGETSLNSLIYLDTSACIENILLGAVNLGLASCYVSGYRKNELSKVLNLPKSHEPIGILPIGYAKGNTSKSHKIDIKEIIHYEEF